MITTNGTYPQSFVTQTFRNAKQVKVAKLSKISHILIQEEIEDTKGVIRIRKAKKEKQHNGQKKKDKRTNNDLQNIHIK